MPNLDIDRLYHFDDDGDVDLSASVVYRNTRNGFAHDADVYVDGVGTYRHTCHYLNRTWEMWHGQSAIEGALSSMRDDVRDDALSGFKDAHGYVNMTATRRGEFDDYLATSDDDAAALWRKVDALYHDVANSTTTWERGAYRIRPRD